MPAVSRNTTYRPVQISGTSSPVEVLVTPLIDNKPLVGLEVASYRNALYVLLLKLINLFGYRTSRKLPLRLRIAYRIWIGLNWGELSECCILSLRSVVTVRTAHNNSQRLFKNSRWYRIEVKNINEFFGQESYAAISRKSSFIFSFGYHAADASAFLMLCISPLATTTRPDIPRLHPSPCNAPLATALCQRLSLARKAGK